MQLNKIMKGVFIALPVVTLMACSSSPSQSDAEAARNAAESAETSSSATNQNQPVVGTVEQVKSPEEIRQEEKEELMGMSNQTVLFDFDRSNVDSDFYSMLQKHADFLIKYPNQRIVVEGHCDKRGTPEYNIALGERRAKSVETFLQNAGVSRSQISVVSFGEEKPVAMGDSESAFRQNRRAVLVYQ